MLLIATVLFGSILFHAEMEECEFNYTTEKWIRNLDSKYLDAGLPTKFQSIPELCSPRMLHSFSASDPDFSSSEAGCSGGLGGGGPGASTASAPPPAPHVDCAPPPLM